MSYFLAATRKKHHLFWKFPFLNVRRNYDMLPFYLKTNNLLITFLCLHFDFRYCNRMCSTGCKWPRYFYSPCTCRTSLDCPVFSWLYLTASWQQFSHVTYQFRFYCGSVCSAWCHGQVVLLLFIFPYDCHVITKHVQV